MKRALHFLVLLVCCICAVFSSESIVDSRFLEAYESGVASANGGDYGTAAQKLEEALAYNPSSLSAVQLLGILKYQLGNIDESLLYLDKAIKMDNYSDLGIAANYVEVLRGSGNIVKAQQEGHIAVRHIGGECKRECVGLLYNLAVVENNLKNADQAIDLLLQAVTHDTTVLKGWQLLCELLMKRSPAEAELQLLRAVAANPGDSTLHFMLGTSLQFQGKLDLALDAYLKAERIDANNYSLKGNIASTYQSLGRVEEAVRYYQAAIPNSPGDAGLYNNYGALLGIMGKDAEQVIWLEKALELNPYLRPALINLAGHYQDEGDLDKARDFLRRAASPKAFSHTIEVGRSAVALLQLREGLMLSPVVRSWAQMHAERRNMTAALKRIAQEIRTVEATTGAPHEKYDVDTSLDRIHFYISYHGLNDRTMQDEIISIYQKYLLIQYYSPYLVTGPAGVFPTWVTSSLQLSHSVPSNPSNHNLLPVSKNLPRKARIGFFSKFFGIFEPHGMLLDGVMRHLPRDRFEVLALPVSRADVKPLAPNIIAACDAVHEISLAYAHAQEMIQDLQLDVLVFADTVSEPMAHFLAHSRLAPIQIAFWGNPITSGSLSIDYFVSADVMEHPYRTRMPIAHEPYSEQLVLMEGQGIWYLRPDIEGDLLNSNLKGLVAAAREYKREDFGLQADWFLYVLPQSVFKIHPLYDLTLRDILAAMPKGHLVVTGGRKPRWTEIYLDRLRTALGPELAPRLHMIERVSSEQFTSLLGIADVILHPFPFDGSKTSADALHAGKPIVTLPTEYLRGRMGAAFMRTMDLPELVARNQSEYVDIAVRLAQDQEFYNRMVGLIAERVDLIWEDMEVPYTWSNLLCGIIGTPAPTWESFLASTGRDVQIEKQRTTTRNSNAASYDKRWGPETWLLQKGVAALETELDSLEQVPCIFRNWQCDSDEVLSFSGVSQASGANDTAITVLSGGAAVTATEQTNLVEPPLQKLEERLSDIRSQYLDLSNVGQFEQALPLALSIYEHYSHFPLYITELGLIYVFVGNYAQGMAYCTQADKMRPDSSLILGCIGLAGMYIPGAQEMTLSALQRAIKLKQQEDARLIAVVGEGRYMTVEEGQRLYEDLSIVNSPVFRLPMYALESNLLQSFRVFKEHAQCVAFCIENNHLPPLLQGASYILALSLVDWSLSIKPDIDYLESALRGKNQFAAPEHVTLWGEIKRVQRTFKHGATVALECLEGLSNSGEHPFIHGILNDLMVLVRHKEDIDDVQASQQAQTQQDQAQSEANQLPISASSSKFVQIHTPKGTSVHNNNNNGVALIVQHYSPTDAAKSSDINIALWKNLENEFISDVYLLNEDATKLVGFPNPHKIHQYKVEDRLTFATAFEFANEYLQNRTVIIANADIFFDGTLRRVAGSGPGKPLLREKKTILALLKWVYNQKTGSMTMNIRTDSQDAWVFQPPIEPEIINQLDFYMGLPRCDNRIVAVFQNHNYTVLDPVFAVHALELDSIVRTQPLYGTKNAVIGETDTLLLSDAFVF